MRLTLLISALKSNPTELISHMKVDSDAVLVNQGDLESEETKEYPFGKVTVIETTERGVGVSRNRCIENSFGDIVLFSDDDIVYKDGYANLVLDEFGKHPEADMIMFNVDVCEERRTYFNDAFKKLSGLGIGRYPAYSIAVRRNVLIDKNLRFSTLFGGGAKYSNGEDSLFLRDAYKKGVKMYASPVNIAKEEVRASTWFEGFTEKFFYDRGVLFAFLYGRTAWLWRIRFILTKKEMFKGPIKRKEANRLMKDGIKQGMREKGQKA